MPVVHLELESFSFKREHTDWIGPLEVSFTKDDTYFILTGINAGGKSLALNALEKFTNLLSDPCKSNKDEFEHLAKVANIDEISATYKCSLPTMEDIFQLDFDNPELIVEVAGGFLDNSLGSVEDIDQIDSEWAIFHRIETRFIKGTGFERRDGMQLIVKNFNEDDLDDFEIDVPDGFGIDEQVFSEWRGVFEKVSELSLDRMFSFGDYNLEKKIYNLTGINIQSEHGFDGICWWERSGRHHFVVNKVINLQVDDAYQVSAETMEKLRPFNENVNSKRKGKSWLNKRLKIAYDKCRKKMMDEAMDEAMEQKLLSDLKKKEDEVKEHQKLFFEKKIEEETFNEIRKEYNSMRGDLRKKTREGVKEFSKFLYPKRRTHKISREDGTLRNIELDWMSSPSPPTVNISFTSEEMKKLPFPSLKEAPKFSNDVEGISGRLLYHCPNLIRDYDPDLLFWIIVSSFIDFPEDPSSMYYSSGQRRIISIIETLMNSEDKHILLIDEPELSLHIDWQRNFIDRILAFGKKIVIATHSPDIIYNHTDKVVEVPPSKEV